MRKSDALPMWLNDLIWILCDLALYSMVDLFKMLAPEHLQSMIKPHIEKDLG